MNSQQVNLEVMISMGGSDACNVGLLGFPKRKKKVVLRYVYI